MSAPLRILADAPAYLAAPGDITSKASTVGLAVLGAAIVVALLVGFFSQQQRRWLFMISIVVIGGFAAMIIGDPSAMATQIGGVIKTYIWDNIISGLS